MLPEIRALVNVLPLIGLLSCTEAPADRPVPTRRPGEFAPVQRRVREGVRHGPLPTPPNLSMRLGDLPPSPPRANAVPSVMASLGAELDGATAGGGGERLDAALDELPKNRVEENGVAALSLTELFGDTFHLGLCEDAEVLLKLEDEAGDTWNASLQMPSYMGFVSDPEADMSAISTSCKDAVLAAGGDLAAAEASGDCIEDDIHQFFEEGSTCRACVEGNGGDFDACVEESSCHEETPSVVWVEEENGPVWYQLAQIYIWACAPDWTELTLILADIEPDGTMPPAFDHPAWAYMCIPYWEESIHGVDWTCFSGEGGAATGDTMAEGQFGRVNWMRPKGDDTSEYFKNQTFYAHSIHFTSGIDMRWFWGYATGAGVFSLPPYEPDSNGNGVYDIEDENYGYSLGGWGLNPLALRPDGTDPTDVDDTFARDWLGTAAMKFSTTRDGIPISTSNFSRCVTWDGPFDDGTYRCTEQGPPIYGWQNDVQNTWWDSTFTQAYPFPIATLASTGLPDPEIPGGIVPLVAGSPALADPEWDNCAWPNTFVPDRAPMEDTPADYGGATSLLGDTWRYGKPDDDLDLRVLLNTNQARGFCSEAP